MVKSTDFNYSVDISISNLNSIDFKEKKTVLFPEMTTNITDSFEDSIADELQI